MQTKNSFPLCLSLMRLLSVRYHCVNKVRSSRASAGCLVAITSKTESFQRWLHRTSSLTNTATPVLAFFYGRIEANLSCAITERWHPLAIFTKSRWQNLRRRYSANPIHGRKFFGQFMQRVASDFQKLPFMNKLQTHRYFHFLGSFF